MNNYEIEYKYQFDDYTHEDFINLVRRAYSTASIKHFNYVDIYYIKSNYITTDTVPYFMRLRSGEGHHELTSKSVMDCIPGIRRETNKPVKDPFQAAKILKDMAYKPVAILAKSCTMMVVDNLSITFDIVNGASGFLEIEIINPESAAQAIDDLNQAESKLGLNFRPRIDNLLFELYTPYKLVRGEIFIPH